MRYKDYKKEEKKKLQNERKIEKIKVTSLAIYCIGLLIPALGVYLYILGQIDADVFYIFIAVAMIYMMALGYRNAYHLGLDGCRLLPIQHGLGVSVMLLILGFFIVDDIFTALGLVLIGFILCSVATFIGVVLGSVMRVMFNKDY